MPDLSGRCIAALVCTLALTGCIVATVPSSHTSAPPPPPPSRPAPVQPVSIDVEYFHDSLDPYGDWIWVEPEGWVWAPEAVDPYWRPYTVGRWAWSDYGWIWVSDEPWGWAAYHYGRWTPTPRYGWVWVPGNVWGPAWVAWRHGPGVVGWAPLPPRVGFSAYGGLDFGDVDINVAIHSSSWCFVDEVHIIEPVHRYIYPVGRNVTVIRRTTPRARIVHREGRIYNDGYPREQAEHALRRPLPRHRVVDGDDRRDGRDEVRGNEVRVWRPNVREGSGRLDAQRRGFGKPRDENLDHARETAKEPPPRQASPTQAPPQVERRRTEEGSERDSDRLPGMRRREASQKPRDPSDQQEGSPSESTAERERSGNAQGATNAPPREQQQQPARERMERDENAHKGQQANRTPTQQEPEKSKPPAQGATNAPPREQQQQQQPARERMERNEKARKGQQANRAPTQQEAEKSQPPAQGATNAPREQQQQPARDRMERNENAHKGQQANRAPTQKDAEKSQPPAKGAAGKAGGKGKAKGKKAAQEGSSDKPEEEKPQQEKPQEDNP